MELTTPLESGASLSITCPACAAHIPLYDPAGSLYAGCGICGNFLKIDNRQYPYIIRKFSSNDWCVADIPLGSRGTVKGKEYIVVGFIKKHEPTEDIYWKEYFLWHPDLDHYRVLAEFNGHWSFIWKRPPGTDYTYDERKDCVRSNLSKKVFKPYVDYRFEIVWAAGAFDWNLLEEAGRMHVSEYLCPPELFVRERMDEKEEWYKGCHYWRGSVASVFGLDVSKLPKPVGESALMGDPERDKAGDAAPIARFTFLMLLLLLISVGLVYMWKPTRLALHTAYTISRDTASWAYRPIVTERFELTRSGAVAVQLQTNVRNEWTELEVALVNDQTGASYEALKTLEFYEGTEEGEHWTEGNQDAELVFSDVPKGFYHLNIIPSAEFNMPHTLNVLVEQNAVLTSNIMLMLLAILCWPLLLLLIKANQNG